MITQEIIYVPYLIEKGDLLVLRKRNSPLETVTLKSIGPVQSKTNSVKFPVMINDKPCKLSSKEWVFIYAIHLATTASEDDEDEEQTDDTGVTFRDMTGEVGKCEYCGKEHAFFATKVNPNA